MPAIIPFEHLEGEKGPILFAHANGYPPLSYTAFLESFNKKYRFLAPYHRPMWPDSFPEDISSWNELAEDTLEFLSQRNISQVIGLGHSLGAVTNLFAAAENPSRFKALIFIDPVFLPPGLLSAFRVMPTAAQRRPMVKATLNRRNHFESREEAFIHFRQKEVFKSWPDETLQHYVQYGLHKNGEGFELAYSREWEAHIYSLPPQVWWAIKKIDIPTLAIRGANSDVLTSRTWNTWQRRQKDATFVEIAGAGHMIPMEKPADLAQHITTFIDNLP